MTDSTTTNQILDQENRYGHHFRTEHLRNDIKIRSIHGGLVTLLAQISKFVLQLASTMVLARLLTPSDFGLVAMVFAITSFVSMFKDAGLSMATIQRAEINHAQISMLFWINLGISALLMLVTAALAPAIVWFYKEPKLAWITVATACTFIFGGLTIQHQALIRRQMRFTVLAVIQVVSMAIGIVAAISFAIITRSYWSLVVMPAAASLGNAVMVWIFCDWRPSMPRRNTGVRPMIKFGINKMAGTALWYFNRNIYGISIGRVFGSELLGIFSKAQNLMVMMLRKVNTPLYSVSFPALSALQYQHKEFRDYYKKAIGMMAFISMPVAVFLIAATEHIVLALLGSQWIKSIPVCRALGPAAFLGTISLAIACVIVPFGKPEREWKIKAAALVLHLVAISIGIKWGIVGAAYALSTTELIIFIPNHLYAFRNTPVRFSDLIAAIWQASVCSSISGIMIFLISQKTLDLHLHHGLSLMLISVTFIGIYFGIFLVLPGGKVKLKGLWTVFRKISNKQRKGLWAR